MNFCSRHAVSLLSGVVLLGLGASATAQDWPQWRGPNRDDKASDFTAPKVWPKELHQKWKVAVGQADATPALAGGKLYVFFRQDDNEVLECLDAAAGNAIWSNKYEVLVINGPAARHPGPRSSPTVAEGKVVTLGVRGTLSCLDAADGKLLWRKNDVHGWPQFFTSMSPLVLNGLCIAQLGGPTNGVVAAYDLSTGDEKWKWDGDGPSYASPVVMTAGDARLIVTQTDKRVVAIDPASGKLVWETPFAPSGMGGANCATPIIDGQTIIYTGVGRGTFAVRLEKQGDTYAAKPLWSNKDISPRFSTPVLKDGLLFGLSDKAGFYCLNAKTGQMDWTDPTVRGGFGSIVDAGSALVALTAKSHLIVFEPSDKAYTELASIKVADTATYAEPVLAGGKLFIEDQNSVALYTLD
ncbi:MAG TPA: PQQ-binding-like beta-propeller repeat protein [Verrucomicrobiae bacterium]|jgi:outer membrane protein assembly factor BamB